MTSDLIVAGAGGARVSDGNGLKSWCGGREQLWFLGDLPSPQPSPAGGRGSKTAGEHRDQRLNSFPRWGKAGMGAAHRPASNAVAPTPTLPQRRREPIHAARSSGAEQAQAERSDGPKGLPHRSGRAEKRRAWGGRGSAACRASCSDSLRLFERSAQARSEFLSDAPRPSIAGCPQRSGGTRPAGSPFSLVTFFLARQKESDCAAGRTSRPAAHPQHTPDSIAARAHPISAHARFPLKP